MIEIEGMGNTILVWQSVGFRAMLIAQGFDLEAVLIDAEKLVRADLDKLQSLLANERQRVKAAGAGSPTY